MKYNQLRDYLDKFDAAGMVNEPVVKALRAVVELHEPYGEIMCIICEGIAYPCSTIKLIETELNG